MARRTRRPKAFTALVLGYVTSQAGKKLNTKAGVATKRKSRLKFGPFGLVASRKAPAPGPNQVAAQVPVKPHSETRTEIQVMEWHSGEMTTEQFVRPSHALRGQMEGFIVDHTSVHTQNAYSKDLKRFVKYLLVRLDRHGPEPLNRLIFVGYKDWLLAEGLEHTTVDRHLSTLRGLFRWLTEEGLLTKNPAERVRFLNPKRLSRTEGFTDVEVRKVLEMPNLHTRVGAQHYAILMMLFYIGLRRSELCSLRTTNFSIESNRRVIKILGKGNRERVIPLVKAVWNALVHYFVIARKDPGIDQWLFSPLKNNRTGDLKRGLDPSTIYYVVKKYSRMAGIQKSVSPHSCRATAISNARDHNVPDRAIQEYAGWASPDMITRYDKRKTAIEKSAALAIRYGLDVLTSGQDAGPDLASGT